MGEKLPVISGKDLIKFFLKYGCELKFVVPVHSSDEIDRGLLRAIIKQSGLDIDQSVDMLKE